MPNNFTPFLRKELIENIRTKRLLVIGCVFLFFAIGSALLARYMGEFMALIMPAGDDLGQAIVSAMGEPTWIDSYLQLYSNLGQMGVFAILFMYMGTIQREVRSGTASLMFSKGLGVGSFVLAKFTVAGVVVTLVTVLSIAITYVYTLLLFGEGGSFGHVMLGSLIFALGCLTILALVMLCSALGKSSAASGGLSVGAYFLLALTSAIPRVSRFTPFALLSRPVEMSMGYISPDLWVNIALGVVVIGLSLALAARRLRKAEG